MTSRRDLIITVLLVVAFTVFVVALAVIPMAGSAGASPAAASASAGAPTGYGSSAAARPEADAAADEDAGTARVAATPAVAAGDDVAASPAASAGAGEVAVVSPSPGLLGGPAALVVGAGALFVAFALSGYAVLRPAGGVAAPSGRQLTPAQALLHKRQAAIGRQRPRIGEIAGHASAAAERTLVRRGWNDRIDLALENAGLELRPGELCVLVATGAGVASITGLVFGGPLMGLLLAVGAVVAARLTLSIRCDRRRARFADQLGDLLQQLSASLRAGHGILQAVEGAARDAESPTSDELRRLTTEIRLGRDFVSALDAIADRMQNEDFRWVVGAIRIHREVGGDLSQVLDRVGETIRSRARLHRQVRALSAEGRMSAYVLLALPIGMGAFLALTNPVYLRPLFTTTLGFLLLGTAGVLLTVGAVWLRAITRLDL